MRSFKVAAFTLSILAGCLAVGLSLARRHQPALVPVASITLVGYTNFIMSDPDKNVYLYPGRGSWLKAHMKLRNEGKASIAYGAWGDEPYGWATAQTPHGSTNGYLAPHFTGGIAVLPPGSSANFWVCLPPDTLSWQCGFSVGTASVRERAFSTICQLRVWSPLQPLCVWSMRSLPDKPGPEVQLMSGLLRVSEDLRALAHKDEPRACPQRGDVPSPNSPRTPGPRSHRRRRRCDSSLRFVMRHTARRQTSRIEPPARSGLLAVEALRGPAAHPQR
jgi:hypothetical protein